MPIPKYDEMYNDVLNVLKDKKEHTIQEIRTYIIKQYNINDLELKETLNAGKNVLANRVGWTATYLKKAGVISSSKRGIFSITNDGLKLLKRNIKITNVELSEFDSFVKFRGEISIKTESIDVKEEKYTPQEEIDNAITTLNSELESELLKEILNQTSDFLENLAVKLITAMGYGKIENAIVTPKTCDEGIDGIVLEDELGINAIYIQTKRFDQDSAISRPDLQKFVGAMAGKNVRKGVFITTSYFGNPAIKYAENQNIVLIDGKKLVKLMIKYNVGCYTETEYKIKKLDLDFFESI